MERCSGDARAGPSAERGGEGARSSGRGENVLTQRSSEAVLDGQAARRTDVLVVVHDQVSYGAQPGMDLTFGRGRSATIRLGVEDPSMHRRAGSFRWVDGRWELHNDGARCVLDAELDGGFEARIAAGASPLILPHGAYGTVHVLTPTPRVLAFATPPAPRPRFVPDHEEEEDPHEASTAGLRAILGFSDGETRMLVALCEPRLRRPRSKVYDIPTTAELCERLGVSAKKVEDLVDGLALKMSRHVPGLIGSNAGRAVTRRQRIAAFAIDTRCVTVSDLRLLDDSA